MKGAKKVMTVFVIVILTVSLVPAMTSAFGVPEEFDDFDGDFTQYDDGNAVIELNGTEDSDSFVFEDPETRNLLSGDSLNFTEIAGDEANGDTNTTYIEVYDADENVSLGDADIHEYLSYNENYTEISFDTVGTFEYRIVVTDTEVAYVEEGNYSDVDMENYTAVGEVVVSDYSVEVPELVSVAGLNVSMNVIGDIDMSSLGVHSSEHEVLLDDWFDSPIESSFALEFDELDDNVTLEFEIEGLEEDMDLGGSWKGYIPSIFRNTAVIVGEGDTNNILDEEGDFSTGDSLTLSGDVIELDIEEGTDTVTVVNNMSLRSSIKMAIGYGYDRSELV